MAAESFVGVRVQGGLLPAELLSRIAAGAVSGQASADYHLAAGETVREAANRAWAYLTGCGRPTGRRPPSCLGRPGYDPDP